MVSVLQDLPGAVTDDRGPPSLPPVREGGEEEEEGEMEIAWRYQNLPKVQVSTLSNYIVPPELPRTLPSSQSSFSTRFGHLFDLTTSMEPSRIQAVKVTTFDPTETLARYVGQPFLTLHAVTQALCSHGRMLNYKCVFPSTRLKLFLLISYLQ